MNIFGKGVVSWLGCALCLTWQNLLTHAKCSWEKETSSVHQIHIVLRASPECFPLFWPATNKL
jgi:hypothetical protein